MTNKAWYETGIPAGVRDLSLLHNVRAVSDTQPSSLSMGMGFVYRGGSGRGVMLTTHPFLVLRLRMSDCITVLPVRAFKAWARMSLPFYENCQNSVSLSLYIYIYHYIYSDTSANE